MAHPPHTDDSEDPPTDRYGAFRCDDQLVIYDLENAHGWLGSDTTVSLGESV